MRCGFLIVALSFLALFTPQGVRAATAYFTAEPDLPLPPGFVEDAEQSTVFDSGLVRILDLVAVATNSADIAGFYAETLPALGWQSTGPGQFTRDQENLSLQVEKAGSGMVLRLRIEPLTKAGF